MPGARTTLRALAGGVGGAINESRIAMSNKTEAKLAETR